MIVSVGFLMEQLDSTIITTAIPSIAESLGTNALRMSLAVTSYVLTLAVFIPVSGWFADRFGARRIFVVALLIFTAGSCLCGMAETLPMLVATRALQGLGGAMMTPVGRLILLRSFPRRELFAAIVYMSLPAVIGPVVGPLLGGVLTTYLSWRWIFFINIPFGLIGALLAIRYLEDFRGSSRVRFDFTGFLLVGIGIALLQFGIENIGRPIIPPLIITADLCAAVCILLLFLRYAGRTAAPAIDLTLFRIRSFRIGTLAGGLCRIGMNGVPYMLPLMLQLGFGMSPIASGSLTFVAAFGTLLVRPISSRLLRKLGFDRLLIISAALCAIAIAGFSMLQTTTPYWLIAIYIAVFGFVRSTQFMSSNTLTYAEMPPERLSLATSLGGVLQQLSVSFGVSLSAALLGLVSEPGQDLTIADFHQAFLVVALIPLIALPGFLFLKPEDGGEVSGHVRGRRPE